MLRSVLNSIHKKFIAVMALTLLVVNIPLLSAYVLMMKSSLEAEFEQKNNAILSANVAALSQPMWDFNYSSLPRFAETILLEGSIEEVFIYDNKSKLIAEAESRKMHDAGDHMTHHVVRREITHKVDDEIHVVGFLEVHFSKVSISQSIWSVVIKSMLLLSVSIVALLVTALFANRYFIAKPLDTLKDAMSMTLESGQKHLVSETQEDEIGQVSQHFNQMQDKLEEESDKIRQAYEKLTDLYNHTPALLYSLDIQGRIKAVSDFWLAATGYFEEEVIGKDFTDFLSGCSLDAYNDRTSFLELQPGQFTEIACSFQKRDGSLMDVLIRESIDHDALSNEALSLAVMTDVTSLKEAEEALRLQAETDSLTGLWNRGGFTKLVHDHVSRANEENTQTGIVFLDLDRFKWVNDNLGHMAGDELLQVVSTRLSSLSRPGEFVSRFGGDEFAILVHGPRTPDRVVDLSQRIMQSFDEPIDIHGRRIDVSVSIGISQYPDHAEGPDELIKTADVAMYHRKKSGRDGYTVFNRRLGQAAGRFLETEELIKEALDNDWFELHLQPIIELSSDRLSGFEALLRLNHPEKGLIPPTEIIATAEKSTRILDIGDRVVEMAMDHLETFQRVPFLRDCYIAVNFSAAQFLPGLPARLAGHFMERGLRPDRLVLEITETVLMQNPEGLSEIFDAIRDLGCRFALDDFGTGYSSLSYMSKFPVSIIKIDRSFVAMMAKEAQEEDISKTQTLVEGIVAMSHRLGLRVVAEGIETDSDLTKLTDIGVDLGQGYCLSKPLPIDSFLPEEYLPGQKVVNL